jgi:hypothetical protein
MRQQLLLLLQELRAEAACFHTIQQTAVVGSSSAAGGTSEAGPLIPRLTEFIQHGLLYLHAASSSSGHGAVSTPKVPSPPAGAIGWSSMSSEEILKALMDNNSGSHRNNQRSDVMGETQALEDGQRESKQAVVL